MAARTNTSELFTVVRDGTVQQLRWVRVPSTPVLVEVAQRVRTRLAAEAETTRPVFVGHSASIPDDA